MQTQEAMFFNGKTVIYSRLNTLSHSQTASQSSILTRNDFAESTLPANFPACLSNAMTQYRSSQHLRSSSEDCTG